MRPQLAVTAGASRSEQLAISVGGVTSMRFPPNLELPRHSHADATIAVVLAGGWRGAYRAGDRECFAPAVVVEPAGEPHDNRFGPIETAVLSLSLHADRLAEAVAAASRRFLYLRDPVIEILARRAANELDRPDDVTPLAVEGAALELLARVTRTGRIDTRLDWIGEAKAVLHDRYADSLSIAEVADAVGVEPAQLVRGFRRAYGESLWSYLRRIRVNAAARLLATTDRPISEVAGEVGFADQSHLTRWFGRYLETTPGRYRGSASKVLVRTPRPSTSDLVLPIYDDSYND